MDTQQEHRAAATFTGRLWTAIMLAGAFRQAIRLPGVFSPAWLAELALPIGGDRPAGQTLALLDGTGFHRQPETGSQQQAGQPGTRVYESIQARSNGWYSLASVQLARLARCPVICGAYDSDRGAASAGRHHDQCPGVAVQMRGAKTWRLWPGPGEPEPQTLATMAGDVLVIPGGLDHDVSTPDSSVHLVFAFRTDTPIQRASPAIHT